MVYLFLELEGKDIRWSLKYERAVSWIAKIGIG
jgi:hypothetical protein